MPSVLNLCLHLCIDALTDQIRTEMDREKRKALCSEAQKILADDLPYLPMWFTDVVSVHRRSLSDPLRPSSRPATTIS